LKKTGFEPVHGLAEDDPETFVVQARAGRGGGFRGLAAKLFPTSGA
jgi:hypothetical protein